jgi:hypothetical protein
MYVCRECEQELNQSSELCPYCGTDLTQPPPGEVVSAKKRANLPRTITLWGMVVASLWGILWVAVPMRFSNPAQQSETRALEAIASLRSALHDYAAAQGAYPPSLEPVGEPAHAAAQWAQSGGYSLQYTPADPGPNGRIANYSLSARAGNYGFRNFFSDDSAVVRATREDRPATIQDPPIK